MSTDLGYQPNLIEAALPVPVSTPATGLLASDLAPELPYTHFSVYLSRHRRFAYFTATNIDGTRWQALPR